VFDLFPNVSWDLGTALLKLTTGWFSKAFWKVYTDFQEALEKSFVAPMQLLHSSCTLQQDGLEKSVKSQKYLARGTIKFVTSIQNKLNQIKKKASAPMIEVLM
jgi:hypothetical protein